jgi:putative transcriptional regulator
MVFIGVEILNLRSINNGKINKNNIRFFLGYTGWEENQLQLEMISNSWIVAANSYKKKIIGKSSAQFWKEQILELGGT